MKTNIETPFGNAKIIIKTPGHVLVSFEKGLVNRVEFSGAVGFWVEQNAYSDNPKSKHVRIGAGTNLARSNGKKLSPNAAGKVKDFAKEAVRQAFLNS